MNIGNSSSESGHHSSAIPPLRVDLVLQIPTFRREVSLIGKEEGFGELVFDSTSTGNGDGTDSFHDIPRDLASPRTSNLNPLFSFLDDDHEMSFPMEYSRHPRIDFSSIIADFPSQVILGAVPIEKMPPPPRLEPKAEETASVASSSSSAALVSAATKADKERYKGIYSKEERLRKIRRYQEKKLRKPPKKKILYTVRQVFANSRPRVGGRFISKAEQRTLPPAPQVPAVVTESDNLVDDLFVNAPEFNSKREREEEAVPQRPPQKKKKSSASASSQVTGAQ